MSFSHIEIDMDLLGLNLADDEAEVSEYNDDSVDPEEVNKRKSTITRLSQSKVAKAVTSEPEERLWFGMKRQFFGLTQEGQQEPNERDLADKASDIISRSEDPNYKTSLASIKADKKPNFFQRLFAKEPPMQYQLQKSIYSDSFCSVSVTWHNRGLRYFQTLSCLYLTACIFLAPYQYFFKESRAIFYACTLSDMFYMLVMLFRSRTTHSTDGIEERNLVTVRSGYQSSFAFAMDLVTFLPLLQLRIPFVELNNSLYLINRQTIIIRLHYIIYYLSK